MSMIGQPSGPLAAVLRTADRIDYWMRRHVHGPDLYRFGLWPAPNRPGRSSVPQTEFFPGLDRSVWLSLGRSLRAQYDALTPPIPPHIAALVERFETKK